LTVTTGVKSSASANGKKRWNGVPKKARSREMSRVAQERWNGVQQSEDQLREYFGAVDLDTALETYATMRKHYEMAGKILDARIQSERNVEECANCHKKFDKDNPWYNREPVKDMQTGIITNVFSCSQACMIALKGKGVRRG